jgi:hypothetical protein
MCRNAIALAARRNLPRTPRKIQQNPVVEVHARQIGRNVPALFVHIVASAGNVRVMDDQRKRLRPLWNIAPRKLRVPVFAQCCVILCIRHRKGELSGNRRSILEAAARQVHDRKSPCFKIQNFSHQAHFRFRVSENQLVDQISVSSSIERGSSRHALFR